MLNDEIEKKYLYKKIQKKKKPIKRMMIKIEIKTNWRTTNFFFLLKSDIKKKINLVKGQLK
jgi:hypothetical protein